MKKITDAITSFRNFITEVRVELKKCAWPTRAELMESTVVVIVSCAIFAGFVALSDVVLMNLLGLII